MFSRTESLALRAVVQDGQGMTKRRTSLTHTSSTFTAVQLEAVRYYDDDGNRKVKRKTITRFGKQNYNSDCKLRKREMWLQSSRAFVITRHQVHNLLN